MRKNLIQKAATKIQSIFRGHLTRTRVKKEQQRQNTAAKKIQDVFRQYRKNKAAKKILSAYRHHKKSNASNRESNLYSFYSSKTLELITKLQKRVKSKLAQRDQIQKPDLKIP